MAAPGSDIDVALEELEARLERLRSLYEQYFIGIEKIEPSIPRQDVDRRIYALRKTQIRNTAKRFRLQNIIQRYNTFQQYWLRICREIENGTYHRHVARAQSRFGDVPLTAAARRRARVPSPDKDQQKEVADQKERVQQSAEDDFNALLTEDPEAALQRALAAAEQVVMKVAARVDEGTPAGLAASASSASSAASATVGGAATPTAGASPAADASAPLAPRDATVTSGRLPPPRASAKGRQLPGAWGTGATGVAGAQAVGGQEAAAAGAQAGNMAPARVAPGGAPAVGAPAGAAGTDTGTDAAKRGARAAGAPPPRRPRTPEGAKRTGSPSVAPSIPADLRPPAGEAPPDAPRAEAGARAEPGARPAAAARPEAGRPSPAAAAPPVAVKPSQRRRSSAPARATAAAAKASTAPGARLQQPREAEAWAALRNPSAPQRVQQAARTEPGRATRPGAVQAPTRTEPGGARPSGAVQAPTRTEPGGARPSGAVQAPRRTEPGGARPSGAVQAPTRTEPGGAGPPGAVQQPTRAESGGAKASAVAKPPVIESEPPSAGASVGEAAARRLEARVSTRASRIDRSDRAPLPRSAVSGTGMVRPPAATSSSGLNAVTSLHVPPRMRAESAAPMRLPTATSAAQAPVATGASPPAITHFPSALPVPRAPTAPSEPSSNAAAAGAAREAANKAADLRAHSKFAATSRLDEQRLDQLHGALVAERRRLNQPGKVSREALGASLRETESKLKQQYSGKPIDFHVVVKDGKAVVKPIIG